MLFGANKIRYRNLVEELKIYFAKGNNDHPATMTEAYNLLINYKKIHPKT